MNTSLIPLYVCIAVTMATLIFATIVVRQAVSTRDRYARALDLLESSIPEVTVDPWALQRELMELSSQRMPPSPTLHNGVVLYAALCLEELSETVLALSDTILNHETFDGRGNVVAKHLLIAGQTMAQSSLVIRDHLKHHDLGTHTLTREEARELFDGTTDVAVVNSGFALSAGLPGAAGYAEVVNSNISKKDPTTGVIEKTADGKWIKGPAYFAPNLDSVLELHAPAWYMRTQSTGADAAST